jgi:hypothetical protein
MITGVAGVVLLVLFYAAAIGSWSWVGVLQRVFVTVLLLWVAIVGARQVRLSRDRTAEPAI